MIGLLDDLSIGPLGLSIADRMNECAEIVRGEWGPPEPIEEFWSEVVTAPVVPVWMGRRNATEYVGLIELVHRRELW